MRAPAGPVVAFVAAVALSGAAAAADLAAGHPEHGAELFARHCAMCHEVGKGARNRAGPVLNGVFDRRAGTAEGFGNYSKDMLRQGRDGLVWSFDNLDVYLENPKNLVSRTRMNFRGLPDPQDRADIMAFLRRFSDNPRDIPEAAPSIRVDHAALARELGVDPAVLEIEGDADYGEYLASECTTCHRADGEDEGIPSITGWPEEDFVLALHAYRNEKRPHPVMRMIAKRLGDEEIAALAAYFRRLGGQSVE